MSGIFSLVKLCTKNYENPFILVKVTVEKSAAPFYLDIVFMDGTLSDNN